MKTVGYSKGAAKALRRLPKDVQTQIVKALTRYAETGAGKVTKLTGRTSCRLRSGDYRAIFNETADTIEVIAVGDRRDIYR